MAEFHDFNFKLVVVDELMYRRKTLTPAFDLDERMQARGIDIPAVYVLENELDEDVLDESRAYFEALEISEELLAGVDSLCFDAGLEIYRHCAPAWDGEDGLFDVRSLDDLALLPGLKRVVAVDDGTLAAPGKWEILAARGISGR
ncbi:MULTISPECIES: DUF6892 domain-containing protein [Streptomyces]|uniref:DUF6892 domain-containing protein n=1 Tax=Streptomyces tsukubensis (strain DSM 42081 / NBRC 108919 / NRRL 18488 / 9993) TaxID=1114943 RepID=I2NB94_STRT9|nr:MULTISPECIES: hypothetical protein [Streptomyces]AZK98028.1 hypothetical protein B7R87_32175 [Streptomyces tsukubensis]EIF94291.1 hypothetical protein [Streptomyces tsukubensis NRRL18488]MYS66219.1 hypothetical protein [Streptomyces sp. SID5473]QKM66050.1 hypothetical protein STSU_001605 [Streptomyces tsukubensis NRRL18488]TAI42330.1 hypothetical protein EWI31_22345 [Streptomyces tsukubensis]